MEESLPQQCDDERYLTQGIRFKTQSVSQHPFKIHRQRSVSPLEIRDRTQSIHTKNIKDKHLMYKKDLLQEKFQNLQINPKQQKKPLKLRLEKVNNQNIMLLKQLNDISNGLEIKFEAQNCILRRSLEKMQRMVSRSIPHKISEVVESSKKPGQRSKIELGPTENQKNLQAQIDTIKEQKQKIQEEIKGMKSVNQFLTNENYKLAMENSMLKQRIMEYEQNDYQNALKSGKDSDLEDNQSADDDKKEEKKEPKEEINQNAQQKSQTMDRKSKTSQKLASQTEFPKKISTQVSQKVPEQSTSSIKKTSNSLSRSVSARPSMLTKETEKKEVIECLKCKKYEKASEEILRLVNQVNRLGDQLEQEKATNENLSNKIALMKLQLTQNARERQRPSEGIDPKMDSSISINMDIKRNKNEKSNPPSDVSEQSQTSQSRDGILESKISDEPPPTPYPHIVTKSNILSNKIIYFAQPIHRQKQKSQHKSSLDVEQNSSIKPKMPFVSAEFPPNQSEEEEEKESENPDEKRKTLCMKKLQIPCLEVEKRRKSITEKLSNSILNKGLVINNSLSFYSNHKIHQLEIIRETISLKFEAFKYTFELFQNQMILWPNGKLNVKELKSILSEYPFFLDQAAVDLLLMYCGIFEAKELKVDKFCNKIKEFIAEYEEMTEEEELILEKKIYKRWKYTKDEILEVMKKNESVNGEITKAKFVSVLQEFKFEEKEIHHLLSQSVAISSDINRIKYKQYLANFLTKK